jgi:mannose/fructose/N-acetylgalactosamine-specific phosphotransferase system component IIB
LEDILRKLDTVISENDKKFAALEEKVEKVQEHKLDDNSAPQVCAIAKEVSKLVLPTMMRMTEDLKTGWEAKTDEKLNDYMQQLLKDVDTRIDRKLSEYQDQMTAVVTHNVSEQIMPQVQRLVKDQLESAKSETGEATAQKKIEMSPNTKKALTDDIHRQIETEMRDREARRNNLVIYGVREIEEGSEEGQTIRNFVTEGLKIKDTIPIEKTIRLGKRKAENNRPILITLKNPKDKEKIFKHAKNLKDGNYSRVSIKNDMTKSERIKDKELRDEATKRNADSQSGDRKFVVRGPPWRRQIVEL